MISLLAHSVLVAYVEVMVLPLPSLVALVALEAFPERLPVTLPVTLPTRSPVIPLINLPAPLTIKSSVVMLSAVTELLKVTLPVTIPPLLFKYVVLIAFPSLSPVARSALVALVAVEALPLMFIPQVPLAPVPSFFTVYDV